MRAPDRERLKDSVDGLQRLIRRARSPLFFLVIIVLAVVVLVAPATPPDATILGIYSAEDGDDASLGLRLASEALPQTGIPLLRTTDAGASLLGDCWSAGVARTLPAPSRPGAASGARYRMQHDSRASFCPRRLEVPGSLGSPLLSWLPLTKSPRQLRSLETASR